MSMMKAAKADMIDMDELVMSPSELDMYLARCCESKADEFRMLGYEQVTGEDIWECVSDKYAKSSKPRLYQAVNDILSLKATQFMNWMTMSIYKGNTL